MPVLQILGMQMSFVGIGDNFSALHHSRFQDDDDEEAEVDLGDDDTVSYSASTWLFSSAVSLMVTNITHSGRWRR